MNIPHPPEYATWMGSALEEAQNTHRSGDVPVGAVIVSPEGTILSRGRNQREAQADPTAHAEIMAIRAAAAALGSWRLTDCTLVVTLEPCAMCAGAIVLAHLGRLVYGAPDPKAGAVGSVMDIVRHRQLNHHPHVYGGVRQEECSALLRNFFAPHRAKRTSADPPQEGA